MKRNKNNLIILSGGGTAGSVSPLIAIADELRQKYDFLLVGTYRGPERKMTGDAGIPFIAIASGKFRRYFSLMNLLDIIFIIIAFFQSLVLLVWKRPVLIITAGSFVSVPLVWVGGLLRIDIHVHQQDLRPGLANRLMAPMAKYVTVSFESSLKYFKNAVWTGNPVRRLQVKSRKSKVKSFDFLNDKPVLLVLGGGTGARALNEFLEKYQDRLLVFCNIIISTGKGKSGGLHSGKGIFVKEFFNSEDMAQVFTSADLVLTRAGLGTLTELAYLSKPILICPMPGTHQEENASYFASDEDIVVSEEKLNSEFIKRIHALLNNKDELRRMGKNLSAKIKLDATKNIIEIILSN